MCYACNDVDHMKRNYTSNSCKTIPNNYCYNCHDFGHREFNYKKPKFDNSNRNSRMFLDTKSIGRRSNEGYNGERNNIVCDK